MSAIHWLEIPFMRRELKKLIRYDPKTGVWFWLVDRNYKTKAGDTAGCINKSDGRWYLKINSQRYSSSRLAWFYMTGEYPKKDVDHEDGNKLNNKWINLRTASRTQNQGNARGRTTLKGVTRVRTGKYTAQIQISMRKIHLGTFATPDEAHQAYVVAAKKLYGEFARAK